MIDPIKGRPVRPQTPIESKPADGAAKAGKASAKFEVSQSAAQQLSRTSGGQFEAMASRIRDGVGRGLDKRQILRELAENELTEFLGPKTPKGLTDQVVEAVTNDPNLSRLFNSLYSKATAG